MLVAGKQIHVPVEGDAKAAGRLPLRGLSVREKDLQIELRGQATEPRSMVLDRMASQDAKAHGLK
jgi:hypothetical protein